MSNYGQPLSEWTPEEVRAHLEATFSAACRHFPDLMEPYVNRLANGDDVEVMRAGLRETFGRRYPKRETSLETAGPMTARKEGSGYHAQGEWYYMKPETAVGFIERLIERENYMSRPDFDFGTLRGNDHDTQER